MRTSLSKVSLAISAVAPKFTERFPEASLIFTRPDEARQFAEADCADQGSDRHALTLHGGSGTDDDDFRRAIDAGMTIVHVGTELRLAWRRGLEAALSAEPENLPIISTGEPLRRCRR
jgi:fructose/tagatose bisphosphate aldolase